MIIRNFWQLEGVRVPHLVVMNVIIGALLIVQGCTPSSIYSEPETLISGYHNIVFGEGKAQINSTPSLYIDFSSGLKNAFSQEKVKLFYDLFINSLDIRKVEIYKLGEGRVAKMSEEDPRMVYAQLSNKGNFVDNYAPLDHAMDSIISRHGEAVMITDGELFLNGSVSGEQFQPWARPQFTTMLREGYTLGFFTLEFLEYNLKKKLFLIFFTPPALSTESLYSRFSYYLQSSREGGEIGSNDYTSFEVSRDCWGLRQEYASPSGGGVNVVAGLDPSTYQNAQGQGFEYHYYGTDWADLVDYVREAVDENGNPIAGGDALVKDLYFRNAPHKGYRGKRLGIRVYVIYDEFEAYRKWEFCKSNPPQEIEGAPIPGPPECYDEEGRPLFSDFKSATDPISVDFLFELDTNGMGSRLAMGKDFEVQLKVAPKFNGAQISQDHENFHRVDVVMEEVRLIPRKQLETALVWNSLFAKGRRNTSLFMSLLGAIKDASPVEQVLYTYYIRSQPNNYFP